VSLQLDEALSAAIDQEIARSGLSDIRWFETALHLMLLGLHQKPRSVCFTVAPNRELDGAVAAAAIRQRGFELSTLAQRQSWDKAALYAAFVEENERGLDFRLLPVQPLEAAWALSQRKGSCRPGWFARLLSPLARLLNPGRGPLDVGLRLAFRLHRWARTLGRRVRGTPRAVTGSGWVLSYRVEEAELPDGVTMRRPPVTKLGLNPFAGTLFISRTHVGIELIVQGPYTPAVLEAYAESYLSVLRGLSDERRSELATTLAHLATRKDVFDPS
jgi:hypothetical protein